MGTCPGQAGAELNTDVLNICGIVSQLNIS